jgi:hypothetical protein
MQNAEFMPPSATLLILEPLRAAVDYVAGQALAADYLPRGDGHPVLVFPGLWASGAATLDLRQRLQRLGYEVYDWEQGVNLWPSDDHDPVLKLLGDHLKQIHARHRRPISLVGWSFGGIYARELAAKNPKLVRQVITLATPIADKADATHAGWLLNMLTSGISRLTVPPMERPAVPPSVPCTSVYSKTDGVVAWQACLLTDSRSHRNIEVEDVSHIGMVHHPEVLRVVAGLLADHLDGSHPPV